MASLRQRDDGRVEIRETVTTPRGPRSRTLATFRGVLTPEVLDRAAARAVQPFDRDEIAARALEVGLALSSRRGDREARDLLRALRSQIPVDPVLVKLLRSALRGSPEGDPPPQLAELAEWIGASPAQHGQALRGLLRVYDRIVRSRAPRRTRPTPTFPRFSSELPETT